MCEVSVCVGVWDGRGRGRLWEVWEAWECRDAWGACCLLERVSVCVYRVSARVPSCGAAFLFAYSFLRAWWRLSARSEVRFVSLGGWLRQHGAEPPARPANGRPA